MMYNGLNIKVQSKIVNSLPQILHVIIQVIVENLEKSIWLEKYDVILGEKGNIEICHSRKSLKEFLVNNIKPHQQHETRIN